MRPDSFIFYKSFYTSINEIPEEYQLRAYKALIEYALSGATPDESEPWIIRAIFKANQINIDKQIEAYENGKRGGRPKKEEKTGDIENEKGGFSEKKGGFSNSKTYKDKDIDKDKDKDKDKDTDIEKDIKENGAERVISISSADKIDYKSIIDYLNQKAGRSYRVTEKTRRLIRARINEGFTEADFYKVIDHKTNVWLNDPKMSQYLRPETLFGTKFEGYLQDRQEYREKYITGELPF